MKQAVEAAMPAQKQHKRLKRFMRYKYLYLLLLLPMLHLLIFRYIPLLGNVIAFRSYQPGGSMFGKSWVGLKHFKMFIGDPNFWNIFKNTIILSVESLAFGFPLPIIFAILLNEAKGIYFKKVVQTISYLPHFISVVVIVGMVNEFLSPSTGIVNMLLQKMGAEPIFFIVKPEWFRTIYVGTGVWQGMGWNSIIYLAALSNIDVGLYEAAKIDGAGRFKQLWHVTLPGIAPTIVILLVISIGQMMSVSFEKVLLLMNGGNQKVAEVISTYTYKMGLVNNNYSYSAAVGLFEGVLGTFLVIGANYISRRVSETSLW